MGSFYGDEMVGRVTLDEARNALDNIIIQHSLIDGVESEYLVQLYEYDENYDAAEKYANAILSIFFTTIATFESNKNPKIHAFYQPPFFEGDGIISVLGELNAFNSPLNFSPIHEDNGSADYLYTLLHNTLLLTLKNIPDGMEYHPGVIKILFRTADDKNSYMFHWNIFPMNIIGVEPDESKKSNVINIKGWDIFTVHLNNFKNKAKFLNKWVLTTSKEEKAAITETLGKIFSAFFNADGGVEGHYKITAFITDGEGLESGEDEWFINNDGENPVTLIPSLEKKHNAFAIIGLALNGYYDNCSIILESSVDGMTKVQSWSMFGRELFPNLDVDSSKMIWNNTSHMIAETESEVNFVEGFPIDLS